MTQKTTPTAWLCAVQSVIGHWLSQRITALLLAPLSIWLLIFLHKALQAPYQETVAWLSAPLNAFALIAWIVCTVYHAALGLQVVLEDYVSDIPTRHTAIKAAHYAFMQIGGGAIVTIIIIIIQS
jgi:succinate dehydrogenase / fumarate reductase, membrane anchor subunit